MARKGQAGHAGTRQKQPALNQFDLLQKPKEGGSNPSTHHQGSIKKRWSRQGDSQRQGAQALYVGRHPLSESIFNANVEEKQPGQNSKPAGPAAKDESNRGPVARRRWLGKGGAQEADTQSHCDRSCRDGEQKKLNVPGLHRRGNEKRTSYRT